MGLLNSPLLCHVAVNLFWLQYNRQNCYKKKTDIIPLILSYRDKAVISRCSDASLGKGNVICVVVHMILL